MSTVSAGDQTSYADAIQVWTSPILNVEPLDEIADALVNQTNITYPVDGLTIDNTSADWLDGDENMLFRIEEPGGTIIAWGVLRKDNTAAAFWPDVKSDGDFGYATNEGIKISDNDVIRIYRNHPNWAMISRVTAAGIQNKRWSKTYTTEGTTPPPVAIMGADQQADVDTGTDLATFSFDASGSYGWISGETIDTFLYTLPSGASVTGGSINTDSVEFTIASGIYTVKLKITSSSGISRFGYRTIYANDTGSNKSFGESFPIESINSDSTDINGWQGQFTVLGDVSADVYPGCKCHWFVPVFYDGLRLTDNDAFIDVFVGYLTEINITTDSNQVKRSLLTFKSPLKVAQLLPSATQTFEEVATATTWTQVIAGLSDPAFAAYYILQFHTTMLDNHDFLHEEGIRDFRRRVFGFPADNISAQLVIVGQIMRGDVGCRSDGTITLTQNPSLLDNDGRNALDSKFTWTEESVRAKLTLGIRFRPQIAYLIMAAVAYDGNPTKPMIAYASKAPGNAQAQGITKTNIPDISITVAGGAAELYGVAGHMFALLNNPLDKLDIPIAKMFDIGDPADADWHVLNISETTYLPVTMDEFGIRWSSIMRLRPTRVARQWSRQNGSWLKTIVQQNRAESFGRPGVFHPIYKGELQPWINPLSGWLDGLDITMPDINIDFDTEGLATDDDWNIAWLFNNFGLSGYSEDWNEERPSYVSAAIDLGGTIVAQALDGGGGGDGYLITYKQAIFPNELISVYENPDISADPTDWTLDHSFDPDTSGGNIAWVPTNIASNASQTLYVVRETQWPAYRYKPSGGAWSSLIQIGAAGGHARYTSTRAPTPIALDGTSAWTMGHDGSGDNILVKQSSVGGAWVKVSNHPGLFPRAFGDITTIARSGTNIFVMYPTVLIFGVASSNLYRIDDATSTWIDITPAGDYVPDRYNALVADGTNLWMIATNPNGKKKLFTSTNSGTDWTDRGETKYDWLYRLSSDDVFILGGDSLLDVTINDFGTFHSRLGRWGTIGSIGILQSFASGGLV